MTSFVSTVSTSSLGCSRCGGVLTTYYQIDGKHLCPRCFAQSSSPVTLPQPLSFPMPDHTSDWLTENVRLRTENETLSQKHLETLASTVRLHLTAPDDDYRDALLLLSLIRFFQAWDRGHEAPTGPIQHPNREA